MAENFWLFTVAGGAAILGLVLVYGTLRMRRLKPTEKAAQERKINELYNDKPEGTQR